MPEADYVWLPREDILHFEEIETLVDVFVGLGVDKVRLTGGEPLLRRDLPDLVGAPRARAPAIRDLAMTTNGVLLARARARAEGRRAAPADRQPRHAARAIASRQLTRYDELDRVLGGHRRRRAALPRAQDRHRGHPRRQRRRAGRPDRVRRAATAPRCASSNTWTSAAPRTGRWIASCRGARCLQRLAGALRRDRAARRGSRRRRPIASGCRTARCSASSRPPRSRSATRAIAAG